jgi:hypothetical protein
MGNRFHINQRVVQSGEAALHHHHYVSSVDILIGIGFLQPVHLQDWKKGKIPNLESVIQGSLGKISFAMKCFRVWAHEKGLKPSQTAYLVRTRGPKRELQFSKSGDPKIEMAYRTHYISPILTERKQEKLKENLEKSPELVVFMIINSAKCSQCQKDLGKGSFLFMKSDKPLCLTCAGFGHLFFLPSGDAQLTRIVKKHSATCIVVLRFSRARKRYERQGIFVEEDAFHKGKIDVERTIIKA